MKNKNERFVVGRFKNPSGVSVWRVTGWLHGKRIRKNFKSEKLARDAAGRLEIDALEAEGRRRLLSTSLTPKQLKIAELLFESAGSDEAVMGLVGRAGSVVQGVPLKVAKSRFLTNQEVIGCREVTMQVMDYVISAFVRSLPVEGTDEVTEPMVRGFVLCPDIKGSSQMDRRKRVSQFMKFCVGQAWMERNFAAELPKVKVERGVPVILSPEQVGALMVAARDHARGHRSGTPIKNTKGMMLGYMLCAAFTGLRPEEARRVSWKNFHLDGELDCIEVSPDMAKVRQCRNVEVLPELVPVLQGCLRVAKRRGLEPTVFIDRQFDLIRVAAGVKGVWCNDILRHTFASWHYALFKDVRRLVYTMGNSEQVLFQNYIRPMNARAAGKYLDVLADLDKK